MVLDKFYDEKVDIWAAGVVLYQLIEGKNPFVDGQLQHAITHKLYKRTSASNGMNDLVDVIFTINPSLRPSALDILNIAFVRHFVS